VRFYSPEGFLHLNILYSSVALQAEIVNEESINQSIIINLTLFKLKAMWVSYKSLKLRKALLLL